MAGAVFSAIYRQKAPVQKEMDEGGYKQEFRLVNVTYYLLVSR